jgi:tripartite-type tricarboxylate transporter receptor subunit TctC
MKRRTAVVALAASGCSLAATGLARAQAGFGSKPFRIYVPFAAGSGSDTGARVYGESLSKLTGQTVIVENRPGASGALAVQAVKMAPADGHHILLASNSPLTVNVVMVKALPYDPFKDIKPIILLGRGPAAFAVRADSPHKSMQDLVAAARREKRPIAAGNYSTGYELLNAWLGTLAGVEINHINYKGASQMLTDVIGGQLELGCADFSGAALSLTKDGRLRMLAITADARVPEMPDVATMKESGFPDFVSWVWSSFYVHSDTPADITQRLAELMQKAVRSEQAKAYQATTPGTQTVAWGPEETRKFQLAEYERFRRIAEAAGLQPR